MGLFDRFKKKVEPASSEESAEVAPVKTTQKPPPSSEPQKGFFSKIRQGLKKTISSLNTDVRDLFKQEGRLVDDDFLRELFELLVKTDMGSGPANESCEQIKTDFRGRVIHKEEALNAIKTKLRQLLDQPEEPIHFASQGPTVILVVGVNGSGKTTSIAKLAHHFHQQGKKVVLGAGDTFRAAAVQQLSIWAERIGVEIIKGQQGGDPASVAHRTIAHGIEIGADLCILDTAGRLQTQINLMQQLEKIRRVISKQIPEAPHEVLLVLDATAGQNAISQAQGFSDTAGCTGIVLAKLDGTAKGGVVIPIRQKFQLPVKYIGTGETLEDLALFQPDQFLDALFSQE